ncbi:MAG: glycosyltransferase family 39 protein [Nostoc sp.]|uniref:ArnT family glycosyltransferase n=1 Tax=Nostoc sp. TaxID=1180 RepID=UPI002FF921BC
MLIFLPTIFYVFLFLIFSSHRKSLRSSLLSSSIILGVTITLITELLSLFHLINYGFLSGFWLFLDIGLVATYFSFSKNKFNLKYYLSNYPFPNFLIYLLVGAFFVVGIVGLIALIAPTNNWDSMDYHMSRIVHWIQNHTVEHYPTSYTPQLYQNPWSEFAIMHFQILSGSDYFANLVQWFSMIGCMVGVSLIAQQLGADLLGQLLATVTTATIPMGILQASSTQNDYVVAFWIVCLAYYVLLIVQKGKTTNLTDYFYLGSSLGLAILTKATAYFYVFPFLLWVVFSHIKYFKFKVWKPGLIVGFVALSLNISHYLRNYNLFGSPLGEPSAYKNEVLGINVMLSNILRNAALHIGTPIGFWNGKAHKIIEIIHIFLGLDANDKRTTFAGNFFVPGGWSTLGLTGNENSAGNLVHFLLLLLCISVFLIRKDFRKQSYLRIYIFATIATFLIFCYLLKWQPWNSRLHLPLFVLTSPFIGLILSKILQRRMAIFLALILIFSSSPWIFYNRYRPIIDSNNIFTVSRIEQYFSNRPYFKDPYTEAVEFLNTKSCSKIGLVLANDPWEYPFWVLMQQTKGKDFHIEHINVTNISVVKEKQAPYKDFEPCGVIHMETKKSKQVQQQEINYKDKTFVRAWNSTGLAVFLKK